MAFKKQDADKRFQARIQKTDVCWLWTGERNWKGYGLFFLDGKKRVATRVAYEKHYGPFDKSLFVLHKCDYPQCVRPDHLFLGNNSDNMQDMLSKGRQNYASTKGEDNGLSKFTDEEIREIIRRNRAGESQRSLAKQFGVVSSTINKIINGRTWSHITRRHNESC